MKLLKLFQPSDEALLNSVKVASPCHESWDAMSGGDKVRSCDRCQKKVYNLSEMTAAEAATLVREAEGRLCIRFYKRADGTMLTTDCPVGAAAGRAKKVRAVAAFSGAAAAAAGIAVGTRRPEPAPTMGSPMPIATTELTRSDKDAFEREIPVPDSGATMGFIAIDPEATMGKVAVDTDKSFLAQHADQIEVSPREDPFHAEAKQPAAPEKRRTGK